MEALFGRGRLGLREKRENVSGYFSFLKKKTMRSINYIYETVNLEQDAKTACLGARYHHRALENIVNMRKMTDKRAEEVSGMVDTRITRPPEGIMSNDMMVLKRMRR